MPVFDIPMVTRDRVRAGKLFLFAFDDDEMRLTETGLAAQCRGEANAIGIRTRRGPGSDPSLAWRDDHLAQHQQMIDDDFAILISWVEAGGPVFLPKAGLGMLQPRLVDTAPRTFLFLQKKVKELRAAAAQPWSIDAYKQPSFYEGVFRQVARHMQPVAGAAAPAATAQQRA
ncbi:MAG: hypothetical protein JO128_05770 [Alphaproteobacteria bacterium]|nr:hypothetical protein [Alphaproteobacteria bacterium]